MNNKRKNIRIKFFTATKIQDKINELVGKLRELDI